jgi:hypothetical protein
VKNMTKEDLEMTSKYMDSYSSWCSNHTCDELSCPVFVERQKQRAREHSGIFHH